MVVSIHCIVNPRSGGGSVGKDWESIRSRIKRKVGDVSFTFTDRKGAASKIARDLSNQGVEVLCVIGGDGTVSEVVDGVLRADRRPGICILNLGTGGDFSRTLGVPGDLDLALDKLKTGKLLAADAGRVLYTSETDATESERYFINITGCGMAGAVVRSVNRSKKRFGGFSYYLGSARNVFTYRSKPIQFRMDGGEWIYRKITTLAICNGQYFGGGMRVAPKSELSDGLLDVTLINDWNLFAKAVYSRNFYNGTILSTPGVEAYRCKVIEVKPDGMTEDPAFIDCDGEDIGVIPMRVEILPRVVSFFV